MEDETSDRHSQTMAGGGAEEERKKRKRQKIEKKKNKETHRRESSRDVAAGWGALLGMRVGRKGGEKKSYRRYSACIR